MNEKEDARFYQEVGKTNGWDFSRITCVTEGEGWDFYEEVARKCRPSDLLLDIGTGGGEKLLALAHAALLLVGIDRSPGMIETAQANLARSGKPNVRLLQMDAGRLEFPPGFFQVASCRQAPFSARETARVLAPGGWFLTQQVSEGDKRNLVEVFGRGRGTEEDGTLKNRYLREVEEAGFTEVQSFDYDATEYYGAREDLLFLLENTPIIPDFGKREQDYAILDEFIAKHRTDKGIRTNSKRFLIIARK
ncbi:class I SAM-dependent methyltransferase [Paenibacillus aurantius]|uniref:Class I SAM-dependent methyltransferase n=1 Tax=Paenibacillus aurantius TaxID=2918900 RepID=A0AA96LEP9_9BACL|nr:class I SAM-dependent methyltransferase [Paenibacillus aurantius]WNQ10745.1 class I SAM-dependent methyltransferase [Paenibacillus aurantius]